MEIGVMGEQVLYGLRQALNVATLRKAMNQDVSGATQLLESMKDIGEMRKIAEPHKGTRIDVKI